MRENLPNRPELDDTNPATWIISFLLFTNEPDVITWHARHQKVITEIEKECRAMISHIDGRAQISVLQKGLTQRHALYKSIETIMTACESYGLPFAVAGARMVEDSVATEAYEHADTPVMKDVTLHAIDVFRSIQSLRDAAEDL